LLKSV